MGVVSLLEVASMPIIQVLIISLLGAFLATDYCNLFPPNARSSLNKIVFSVFTPSLMFANLAKTVTFEDIVSWWFMPVNIGVTFLLGGFLGWIVVKILKPKPYLESLVIAFCASGNLGNLLLIIIPAVCNEEGSPFGDRNICTSVGLSYASFSMALGGFFIWTYTYHCVKVSSMTLKLEAEAEAEAEAATEISKSNNNILIHTPLLLHQHQQHDGDGDGDAFTLPISSPKTLEQVELSGGVGRWISIGVVKILHSLHHIIHELMAPPTLAAMVGLMFGAITWLRNLIIGDTAPLRVIQDSIQLLGNGTIPSITLILGGNLTQGLRSSRVKPSLIVGVVIVRYILLPLIGIFLVRTAAHLGFLPTDPLYQFVLMIQYTLPPAMTIGTMTQLFDVGQEECSVIMLWTYLVAALALALWSALFMWTLS